MAQIALFKITVNFITLFVLMSKIAKLFISAMPIFVEVAIVMLEF